MRLSEWRSGAPNREALGPRVTAVLEPVLGALGAGPDPELWVVWGEDPGTRYTMLLPITAGLGVVNVRVSVPGEGPRASGRLVRWSRLQFGELDVEAQAGHLLASIQVEGLVLRGVDAAAGQMAAFVRTVMAGADGRPLPGASRGKRAPAPALGSRRARDSDSAGPGSSGARRSR